ncbi:MAG: hypothetical protein ACUZ8H_03345 [Candidatus Anammoxibacter sp.]
MYNRGTLEDFNVWHNNIKVSEGIVAGGRVGSIKGVLAPDNQRTTTYSTALPHPSNDDYVWNYGGHPDAEKEDLSTDDVKSLGWFPNEV